jgi:CO/xanthine dehydrogenase Mo-binding subunit
MSISRRLFLKMALSSSGSLVLGLRHTPALANDEPLASLSLNPFVEITADNRIILMIHKSEMGQGVETALAQLLAEELEVDWNRVETRFAPVAEVYFNKESNLQTTGNSTSIPHSWDDLRIMGASARELLRLAAAKEWFVPVSECIARDGTIIHMPSSRAFRYGDLLNSAAQLEPPKEIPLKHLSKHRYIGKSKRRLDIPAKVNGTAIYGIDVQLPNLHTATVVHPPVFGAQLQSFDDQAARKIKGVVDIFPISRGVAVVATGYWPAQQAARALKIQWQGGKRELDSDSLKRHWTGLARQSGDEIRDDGDAAAVLETADNKLAAIYELPYQAHATMEPMNCTVRIENDHCEVWVPTQSQSTTEFFAAQISALPREQVTVHTTYLGGGFGRRGEADFVIEATEIAVKSGLPIKLIWSREEDMQHDYYRPATYHTLKSAFNDAGLPIAWQHHLIGTGLMERVAEDNAPALIPDWAPDFVRDATAWSAKKVMGWSDDPTLLEGAQNLPYNIENIRVESTRHDPGVPVGFWRSVGNSHNAYVVESFLDEIAVNTQQDPFELRRELLGDQPRSLALLDLLAEHADWGQPESGLAQGMALHHAYNGVCGQVVEVSINRHNEVRVERVVCVVDCGLVVNPDIVAAQLEGGIVFGLTAALKSEITLEQGRVKQSNFHDFQLLNITEMPRIETYIVPSEETPGGIGEVAVPPIAPALTNAIFAASGKRIRRLPISPEVLAKA